jgi:hypothetical protein
LTNIDAIHALAVIAKFLLTSLLCAGAPHATIIHGLEILMRNIVFQFGNTFWHQTKGSTMGTTSLYTTLYFGIHKWETVPLFKRCFWTTVVTLMTYWVPGFTTRILTPGQQKLSCLPRFFDELLQ